MYTFKLRMLSGLFILRSALFCSGCIFLIKRFRATFQVTKNNHKTEIKTANQNSITKLRIKLQKKNSGG